MDRPGANLSAWLRPLLSQGAAIMGLVALALLGLASAAEDESPFPVFTVESAPDYLRAVARRTSAELGDSPEAVLLAARLLSQLGQQDSAEQLAIEGLRRAPARAELAVFVADLRLRQGRLEAAQEAVELALRTTPDLPGGQRRLGLILDRRGERAAARAAFEKAVQQDPTEATAHLLLGQLLCDQEQLTEAVPHLEKACELAPNSANGFYALARAQARNGNQEAARQTLAVFQRLKREEQARANARNEARDNARELRSVAAAFHVEAAGLVLESGRPKSAEAHLRQAVAIAPELTGARERLGAFLLQRGRLAAARPIYEELTRLEPDRASHQANLGTLLLRLEDYPSAVAALRRALELDPDQPAALNNLARFYLGNRRELPTALLLSRRLVAAHPGAAHYDLLAWACFANGETAAAREAAAQSVALAPENPAYRERLRRLETLP